MLNNYKEQTTISAESIVTVVDENGTEKKVKAAYMSANINSVGHLNVTKTISDITAYEGNKAAVRNDMAEFETKVYAFEDGDAE